MIWGIAFGLASSLCWGTADFAGGVQARRLPALAVAFWSQLIAGSLLIVALLALPQLAGPVNTHGIGWGLAAGLCGGTALLLFYRALSIGVMSIVAPITACGAIVPVVGGVLLGERPGPLAWIGMVAALVGVVLVSLQPGAGTTTSRQERKAIPLAIAAAVGLGLALLLLARAVATPGASPFWANVWLRSGSVPLLALLQLSSRRRLDWPGRRAGLIGLTGVLDLGANIFFAAATQSAALGVVGVLGSLYPVVTVILGGVVLSERLTRPQYGGVALALAGVALLAAG